MSTKSSNAFKNKVYLTMTYFTSRIVHIMQPEPDYLSCVFERITKPTLQTYFKCQLLLGYFKKKQLYLAIHFGPSVGFRKANGMLKSTHRLLKYRLIRSSNRVFNHPYALKVLYSKTSQYVHNTYNNVDNASFFLIIMVSQMSSIQNL